MQTLWNDLRFSLRTLTKSPGFTLTAVLTLALGMGANTAIFSVVNSALLKPLPYKQADRLVVVWEKNPYRSNALNVISPANFFDWQEQNTVFEQMGTFFDWRANLTGDGEPEESPIQYVSTNLFRLLGVHPSIGRDFSAEDGQKGHDRVVILSYELWQRRFGGDMHIVGKNIQVDGAPMTVIGIMPKGFQLYVRTGSMTRGKAELWNPFVFGPNSRKRAGRYLMAIARLKPGVLLGHAQGEMHAIGARLEQQYPDFNKGWGVSLIPLHEELTREIRLALLVLLGTVVFVLLIACANVANLLLSRAAARQREISIRIAMGAGRWRITRQMLTENILLAAFGGVLGVLMAIWGVDLLLAMSPPGLLDITHIGADMRILGFTAGVSFVAALVFGLAPALQTLRSPINESLKEGGRGGSAGVRSHFLRNAFVIAEVALALVLLAGSGLLIRSFAHLANADPGFQAKNLLTVKLSLPGSKYGQDQARVVFFHQLLDRIRSLPGVQSASANSLLPFTAGGVATSFTIVGRPEPPAGKHQSVDVRVIEPDYFKTMGIPLRKGRLFTEQESSVESHVVIVSEALARQHFPDEDPIGKKIIIAMKSVNVPSEIVGVVGDAKHQGLDSKPMAMSYWPYPELTYNFMTLVVRARSNPATLVPAIREEVREMDKDQPVSEIATMEQLLWTSLSRARFSMLLMSVFAGIAVLLAAVGVFGVMSYAVTQRTNEIGIRMAIGAQSADVSRLVVSDGMRLSLVGVGLGAVAALALTRVLQSLLFEVQAGDPVTFVTVTMVLLGISLLACYLPARRATRVDPLIALRHQ
ncbi:MAG TPA: ABC transporter permease [Candidatus Dormibacteraeota bacterium]|nr:ABC transporter permease [Candidatus Dormibacteraeota bacterium]